MVWLLVSVVMVLIWCPAQAKAVPAVVVLVDPP
jgi:hypothetical protein